MRFIVLVYVLITILPLDVPAQLGTGVALMIDDETIPDGWYGITLRYYASSIDTVPLATETLSGRFSNGRCHLVYGTTITIPAAFVESTTATIGYSLNEGPERQPRITIARVPYATRTEHARMADLLSPTFTGLVTSINEVAGPVTLMGVDGLRIERRGSTIVLTPPTQRSERGSIQGDNVSYEFTLTPSFPISDRTRVTVSLRNSTTQIALTTRTNTTNGTIIIQAAAVLLDTEHIDWEVTP